MHAHACYIVAWGTKLYLVWKQKYISYKYFKLKLKLDFSQETIPTWILFLAWKINSIKCAAISAQRPNVLSALSSFTDD